SGVKLNLENMMKAKDKAVTGLTKGVESLFKKNGVDYVKGHGRLVSANEIEVDGLDGNKISLKSKNIIIATGSEPTPFKGLEVDEKQIVTST
ncbi:319_t:CDS:2, partial [Racocetra persica]